MMEEALRLIKILSQLLKIILSLPAILLAMLEDGDPLGEE